MRVLAFILSVLVSTALLAGAILLLVFAAPPRVDWTVIVATVGVSFLIYCPLTLGSLTAYWDFGGDDANRRLLRRWYLVIGLVELAAIASLVAYGVVNGSPWWVPALFSVVGVGLTLAAIPLGRALLRRDVATRKPEPEWIPVTRQQILRKIVGVALTFGITLVVGLVLAGVFFGVLAGRPRDVGPVVGLAVALAFFAGGFACIIVALPLNRLLRESTGRDLARLRKIAKVVLRGKPIDLDADERVDAAKYAQLASITMPFQLAYLLMLYVGIGTQQVMRLGSSDLGTYSLVLLILLVVFLVVFVPLFVVRIRRARRYAVEHASLIPGSGTAPTPAGSGAGG